MHPILPQEKLVRQEIPVLTPEKTAHSIRRMSIHKRIKERREGLGLSMRELAEQSGVRAYQTVQQWEQEGGTAPKRARLEAVAQALKTTPEYLLYGTGEATHEASEWPFVSVSKDDYRLISDDDRRMIESVIKVIIEAKRNRPDLGPLLSEAEEQTLMASRPEGEDGRRAGGRKG